MSPSQEPKAHREQLFMRMKKLQRDLQGVVRLVNATAPIHRRPDEIVTEMFLFYSRPRMVLGAPGGYRTVLSGPSYCVRPLVLDYMHYRAVLANCQRAQRELLAKAVHSALCRCPSGFDSPKTVYALAHIRLFQKRLSLRPSAFTNIARTPTLFLLGLLYRAVLPILESLTTSTWQRRTRDSSSDTSPAWRSSW